MPEKHFKLEVITPDRVVLSDSQIVSVVAPGIEGYLGVLANHAPLMTELTIGEMDYRRADGTFDSIALNDGFMEVHENTVTVLTGAAETSTEIDIERAEQSLQRAKERITSHAQDIDLERARIALLRAMTRIRVAQRRH